MKQIKNPQNEEVKNVIFAMILVTIIMFAFNYFNAQKSQDIVAPNNQISQSETVIQETTSAMVENKDVSPEYDVEPVELQNEYVRAFFNPSLGGFENLSLLK